MRKRMCILLRLSIPVSTSIVNLNKGAICIFCSKMRTEFNVNCGFPPKSDIYKRGYAN
ncbi:hypothetical protein PR003_g8471 [Phytophthora rubi]|uniref:PiggyBac transposable element-derived protein 4 C-terminal zinc-ribbon domain-containing protein n=1 Tax=Phytophthora rubi TaxID=129364 RepID=A0A6A3M9Q3_9STRA|nr:hypothetical protein PR001_g11653 [Phytophthora rubi]KAE9036821.1 hypothetical protein PR002_g6895 [Phytophthora rubi]KAE9344431.1 hypothetical protein PR003_g8471 [Phytophthora rubi]